MPMGGLLPYPGDIQAAIDIDDQTVDLDARQPQEFTRGGDPSSIEVQDRTAQAQLDADADVYGQRARAAAQKALLQRSGILNNVNSSGAGAGQAAAPQAAPDAHQMGAKDVQKYPEVQASNQGSAQELRSQEAENEARRLAAQRIGEYSRPKGKPLEHATGFAFGPMGGKDVADRPLDTAAKAAQSARVLEQVQKAEIIEQEDLLRQARQEQDAKYAHDQYERAMEQQEIKNRLGQIEDESKRIAKMHFDKGRIFRNPAGALGAMASIFMPLFSSDPMAGVKLIDQQIQRDLDLQEKEMMMAQQGQKMKGNLLSEYMALTKNAEQARMMASARMKEASAMKLQELGLRYQGQKLGPQTEMVIAHLQQNAADEVMKRNLMAYREYQTLLPGQRAQLDKFAQDSGVGDKFFGEPIRNEGTGQRLTREADQMMGGMDKNLQQPSSVELARAGQLPPDEKPEVTLKKAGFTQSHVNTVSSAAKAIARVKMPQVSQRLKERGIDAEVHDTIDTVMPEYLQKHTKNGVTDTDAAVKEALTDLQKAADEGVPNIEKAQAEYTAGITAVSKARHTLKQLKAEAGPKADEIFRDGILFQQGDVTNETWNTIKQRWGLDDKQTNAVRQIRQELGLARDTISKPIYGNITSGDDKRMGQIINPRMGLDEWDHAMEQFSTQAEAKQQNAMGHGTPMARFLYRARRNNVVKPQDNNGIKGQ